MTELLQRVIAELKKLPEDEQDAIATRLLAELEDERARKVGFESTTNQQWDRLALTIPQEIIPGDTVPDQLTQEALSLPITSRALLAEKLIESFEFDTNPATQAAWATEAKRRRDEIRSGAVEPIPGEEALAQVRQLLEQ